tara:strand:- start:206 stop:415 length:210 start_codon:yes stop_codon:yes gene_type:complete
MRYVSAYLLAALGGNEAPGAADIKKILDAVGASCDDEELNKVLAELKDKSLEEVSFLKRSTNSLCKCAL